MDGDKPNQGDIEHGMKRAIHMYTIRGLMVTQVNTVNEFTCIQEVIRLTNFNTLAAGDHVGDKERSWRSIKESTRCHVNRLPYSRYPKIMII